MHCAMQDQDTLVARKKRKASNRTQTRAIAGASVEVGRIARASALGAGRPQAARQPTRIGHWGSLTGGVTSLS